MENQRIIAMVKGMHDHLGLRSMIIMVMILLLSVASGQQKIIRFSRTSLEQGLSQSSVQCLVQDADGFIWIGTQNGLNRFDGKNMISYYHDPYTRGSMTNSVVLSLETDDSGYLWIGTMGGGLMRFDPVTENFHSFLLIEEQTGVKASMIWSLEFDDQRRCMWIGAGKGLFCYSLPEHEFTWQSAPGSALGDIMGETGIMCILNSRDGSVWLGSNAIGLIHYFPENKSAQVFSHVPGRAGSLSDNIVWSLSEDVNGGLWVGTNHGLNHLRNGQKIFRSYFKSDTTLADNLVWSLRHDHLGNLWIGTNHGLNKLDLSDGGFETFRNRQDDPYSISNNIVWSIIEDKSGVMLAGTSEGLNSFSPALTRFPALTYNPENPEAFPRETVTAIMEDHLGRLWVGTDGGGLCMIDNDHCTMNFKHSVSDNGSLSGNHVWSLFEDHAGLIWIGTYGAGLNCLDPLSGRIIQFPWNPSDPLSLPNNRVLIIYEDQHGFIWIGTRGGGLARLDKKSGQFNAYLHDENDTLSISGNTVTSIMEDSQGRMWAGTFTNGLNLFNKQTGSFLQFRDSLGRPFLSNQSDIWSIVEDESANLWIGTSSGLFKIDQVDVVQQTVTFKHYTTADGLPDNFIIGLLRGNDRKMWMSTCKGLVCFDPATDAIKNYDVFDGLQSNEFAQGSFHAGHSGKLYFGGIHGLNAFYPEEIPDLTFKSDVFLTGMKLFYSDIGILKPLDDDPKIPDAGNHDEEPKIKIISQDKNYFLPCNFLRIKELELNFDQDVLTFDFTAPEYFKPAKIQYLCCMEGFEDQWNNVANTGRITYTNLDPGRYTLKVTAKNGDHVMAPHELRLSLFVRPPYWKRPWFSVTGILLALFLVTGGVALIISLKNRKDRQEAERENEMLELQLKAIRSQINPHFTFNAINSIGSFIYSNDPNRTYDYFTKFSKLIRHTLQSTDRLYVPLDEEIDFIKTYLELESVRFKNKFDYTIILDPAIDKKVKVPKMILHIHTENAIKHGLINKDSDGKLMISVEKEDDKLVFTIEDNGIGRLKSAEFSKYSTHRGYKILDELFSLHFRIYHQHIVQKITDRADENGLPCGTAVTIVFPIVEEIEN